LTLSGVPRMHERPIGDLVDALRQLGCAIDYLGNEGFPPLRLRPGQLGAAGAHHGCVATSPASS
jgi:5-enolpyruvylshikimate-3-phosphate synthase